MCCTAIPTTAPQPLPLGHRLPGACPDCKRDLVLRHSKRLNHPYYECAAYSVSCRVSQAADAFGRPAGLPVGAKKGGAR